MNDELKPKAQAMRAELGAFLRTAHLQQPFDLPLLLLPGLWASWSASQGSPSWGGLAWLLALLLSLRSALLMIRDLLPALRDPIPDTPAKWLAAWQGLPQQMRLGVPALLAVVLSLAAFGGRPAWAMLAGLGLVAGVYEYLRRRTYLGEMLLALGLALSVPAAYLSQGAAPDKLAGLLTVATILYVVVYRVQWIVLHLSRHVLDGEKNLAMLFGASERLPIALIQGTLLFTLYLAGRLESFGPHYAVGLGVALAVMAYQQWLMRHGTRAYLYAAYLYNSWLALAVFGGIALHYLCACVVPPA